LARNEPDQAEIVLPDNAVPRESYYKRLKSIPGYIEYDLLGSLANALVVGIIAAGIISALIPDGFLKNTLAVIFYPCF